MATARELVGLVVAVVFGALGLLHVYWALGGRFAQSVVVPEVNGRKTLHPGPFATLVVAGLLACACVVVVVRAGFAGDHVGAARVASLGVWVLALVFALRAVGDLRTVGFFKRVRSTPFARWDTRLYSPLCLVLSLACFFLALA